VCGKKQLRRKATHITLKRRNINHQKVSIHAGTILLNGAQYITVQSCASYTCVGEVIKRIILYYVCYRDGNYHPSTKPRLTGKQHPHQKDTRKINDTCISRMYIDYCQVGHVTVTHIMAHTNHTPGRDEDKYLPIPKSIKSVMEERIMDGTVLYIHIFRWPVI